MERCPKQELPQVPPERLGELITALRARGIPIDLEVAVGEEARVEATLEVAEEDEAWLRDFLAGPAARCPGTTTVERSAGAVGTGDGRARTADPVEGRRRPVIHRRDSRRSAAPRGDDHR
jgi:hypothetical protein